MRKGITIFIMILPLLANSQQLSDSETRKEILETVNWIIEKLNKYALSGVGETFDYAFVDEHEQKWGSSKDVVNDYRFNFN